MQGQLFNSETKSQESAILEWLRAGHSLTQLDGLRLFQCLRVGARVHNLRKQGYDIESKMVVVESGKRVARYTLRNESQ